MPTIVNFNLVADGHIADILEESMTDVSEALRLWSPLRSAKNVHAVVEWANAMLSMIAFCDESSSLYLQTIIYAYVQNDGSDVAVGCDTSSDDGRALFWTSLDDDWRG